MTQEVEKVMRSARAALRKRFPTANELTYDYGHSFVVSYSPTENGIDGIVALSARADGVFLYFNQGPKLPDPKGILQGKAKQTRFVPLETAGRLADPDVKAFIAATIDHAKIPFPTKGKGRLIVKTSRKPAK